MSTTGDTPKFIGSIGFWMALLMIISQLINAIRAFLDPAAFAVYMGLPLTNAADIGFVEVYGLRALFLAVFAAALIYARQIRSLSMLALCAVIMPIGDVILVTSAGAPSAIIIRHVVIGVFLLLAWFFLNRWCRANMMPAKNI
jgi:Domain of unknown function (DUF4267)